MWTERQALCNIKPPSAQSLHGLRALSSHFCPHRWSGARDWDPQVSPRLCRCGCGGPAPHAAPPSPPRSPSGPGGAPLHSGPHLFPLHRRAAHEAE